MLYTLSRSPSYCDLPTLLRLTTRSDALLLLQDGVLAGLAGSANLDLLLNASLSLYALRNDVQARGLSDHFSNKIEIISYMGFVELTQEHGCQLAW